MLRSLVLALAYVGFVVSPSYAHESFADLAEELLPGVVNISTSQEVEVGGSPFSFFFHGLPEGEDSPFKEMPDLLERFYGGKQGEQRKKTRKSTSLGSGFIISDDGYIVTNHHVIEKAEEITVIFHDEDAPLQCF